MVSRFHWFHFCLFLLYTGFSYAQNAPQKNASLPVWVEHISPAYDASDSDATSSGYYYLLIDKQINTGSSQHFYHFAIKILNNEGVQEMSDLSFDYDPAYQKLTLHQIDIIRDNQVIRKLKQQQIRSIQREDNMERHMYDGMLTSIANLTDIRSGDIIEYAYTTTGENPIFEGHFDDKLYFQYGVPVEHQYTRLLLTGNRKMQFKYRNGAVQPQIKTMNGNTSYVWEYGRMKSLLYDINTPSWYDPYPSVFVSDYESWGAISGQFEKYYALDDQKKKELKKKIENLTKDSVLDSVIIKLIRFVQDDIRYLAFEDGINSHKPDLPLKVLNQRYGDCKAKSFLLSEMLRSCGIDASPVLVNAEKGMIIEDYLPTPNAFNHCIVQINRYGKAYYIDPTLSNQGGDLEHYYCPYYHLGLVLKQDEKSLVKIPFWGYTNTRVTETFHMKEIGKSASLYVHTVYTGGDADSQRATFKSTNLESAQKSYLDFYSKLYPNIRADGSLKITDTREINNEFITDEHYIIDSLWEKSDDNPKMLVASFYPLSLESLVSGKKSPKRTMPYRVIYPVDFEHTTEIVLPEDWSANNATESIHTESVRYDYRVNKIENTIFISHKYKTLCEYIEAGKAESFIAKHEDIMNKFSYVLTYSKSPASDGFRISWTALAVALAVLIVGSFIAVKIFKNYDVGFVCSTHNSMPIGGWLVLIGIGLVFSPLRMVIELSKTPQYFNSNVWNSLLQAYGSTKGLLLGALMSFELIYNILLPVFFVLAASLFFSRRTIFPKIAIILYITISAVTLFDYLASRGLNPAVFGENDKSASYKSIAQNIVIAAIWVPYLLYSDRVKNTFVFRSRKNAVSHSDMVPEIMP
jgi:hypothetical protein